MIDAGVRRSYQILAKSCDKARQFLSWRIHLGRTYEDLERILTSSTAAKIDHPSSRPAKAVEPLACACLPFDSCHDM